MQQEFEILEFSENGDVFEIIEGTPKKEVEAVISLKTFERDIGIMEDILLISCGIFIQIYREWIEEMKQMFNKN